MTGMLVALALFSLLASDELVRAARGLPLDGFTGTARHAVLLPTARGIDRVANALSLNRPYDLAAAALGRSTAVDSDERFEFPTPTTVPAEIVPPPPPIRVGTAAAPLRIMVAGDSTARNLGDVMTAELQPRVDLAVRQAGTPATGLARRDFVDWGSKLTGLLADGDPEIVVFMIGANDNQELTLPDGQVVAERGTEAWSAEYRRRVAGIMDLVNGRGRRLIWVGQPAVKQRAMDTALVAMNGIAEQEAAGRNWVTYLSSRELVDGPAGTYADFTTDAGGGRVRCRAGDGVHLTVDCIRPLVAGVVGDPPGIIPPEPVAAKPVTPTILTPDGSTIPQ